MQLRIGVSVVMKASIKPLVAHLLGPYRGAILGTSADDLEKDRPKPPFSLISSIAA